MILSRIRLLPNQRYDLEDLNSMLSGVRTDAKYNIKKLISNLNYVVNGFTVTGIGLKIATVNMTEGTLMIPQGTSDFSWYTTSPLDSNVVIPDSQLVDGVRNYIEMELQTETHTPVVKAFWDSNSNSGNGLEFNQITDTITDLTVKFIVVQGGFSGSPDRLPLCIIDTDGTGTIKQILDERKLFHRLGSPSNPQNQFAWGTKDEPQYTMTMTSVVGIFQAGEILNIGTETATIVTGGTTTITFKLPSSRNIFHLDAVLGVTSGATGTVNTISESFTGVDKSIMNLKQDLDAIKTELLLIKNPNGFWWSSTESIVSLRAAIDAINAILEAPSYDEDTVLLAPVLQGSNITIPLNSRLPGNPQQLYIVGKGAIEIFLNGQRLSQDVAGGFYEVGTVGNTSSLIQIDQDLNIDDIIKFRLGLGGLGSGGGGGGGGAAADDNFFTLPASSVADLADYVLIYDVSSNAYRKQLRSTFLSGVSNLKNITQTSSNMTANATSQDVILVDCTAGNITISLPDPSTCSGKEFIIKKIDVSLNSVIINGAGFNLDGAPSHTFNVNYEFFRLVASSATASWWFV